MRTDQDQDQENKDKENKEAQEKKRKQEQEAYIKLSPPSLYPAHGWSMSGRKEEDEEKDENENSISEMKTKDPTWFEKGRYYTHEKSADFSIHYTKDGEVKVVGNHKNADTESPEAIKLQADFLLAAGAKRLIYDIKDFNRSNAYYIDRIRAVISAAYERGMGVELGSGIMNSFLEKCTAKERDEIIKAVDGVNKHHEQVKILKGVAEGDTDKKYARDDKILKEVDNTAFNQQYVDKQLTDGKALDIPNNDPHKNHVDNAEKQIKILNSAIDKNVADTQKLDEVFKDLKKEKEKMEDLLKNPSKPDDTENMPFINVRKKSADEKGLSGVKQEEKVINSVRNGYINNMNKFEGMCDDIVSKSDIIGSKNIALHEKLSELRQKLVSKKHDLENNINLPQGLSDDDKNKFIESYDNQIKKIDESLNKIKTEPVPNNQNQVRDKTSQDLKTEMLKVKTEHYNLPDKIKIAMDKIDDKKQQLRH